MLRRRGSLLLESLLGAGRGDGARLLLLGVELSGGEEECGGESERREGFCEAGGHGELRRTIQKGRFAMQRRSCMRVRGVGCAGRGRRFGEEKSQKRGSQGRLKIPTGV